MSKEQIAFATEGHSDPYGRTAMSGLWVVEVEGGEPRQLTEGDAMQPSWSPDGKRIAFWGLRDFTAGGAQREIGTISAAGGGPVWATEDPAVDWSPVWSPDSVSLYYISDRGGSANIWRLDLDPESGEAAGSARPLTAPSRLVSRISISGDGKQLVFTDENISSNVARVALDTENGAGLPVAVTRGGSEFLQAQASPDGEWVAFRSAGGQEDLYVVRSDGSGLLQLTDDPAKDRRPDWSPDGSKIVATHSSASAIWDLSSPRPVREYELLPMIDDSGRFLFSPEGAFGLTPSSDGKTVTFIQGVEETDLWLASFE